MPTIQVEARVSPEQLLRAVDQMSADELGTFARQVLELRARRVAPLLSSDESALLDRINAALPPAHMARYQDLSRRREAETLTEAEHAELITLSDALESLDADRVAALAELAKVRGTTLDAAMASFGIPSPR